MFGDLDLKKLNSLTKYPSIPTFHTMGDKGRLGEQAVRFPGPAIATEKVDGTNTRVLVAPDGSFIVGSREELLHHRGDLCWNPSLGIVEALSPFIDRFASSPAVLQVWFGETFGAKIGRNAKQYTGDRSRTGFRIFDVLLLRWAELEEMMGWELSRISSWRETGGQRFLDEAELAHSVDEAGLELTPRLGRFDQLPADLQKMSDMLNQLLPTTRVALDSAGLGLPEGLVLRSPDRSVIAKARVRDYRRTLG